MSADEIPTYCFEKPSLYLLALLLGPQNETSSMVVPSDFGPLTFKSMDLLQQRGQIPKLELSYELERGTFRAVYFGHVSPFKLGAVELLREGEAEINLVFSEAGKVHIPMHAASQVADLPPGFDWKILAGSLCLWRACTGLPNGCDPSLGKYFNKMKSVSRYQWNNVSYEIQGNDILEEWSSSFSDTENGEMKISFFVKNGLLASLKY